MSDMKLKPCPFCGGEPKMVDVTPTPGYVPESHWVLCESCGATSDVFKKQKKAVEAWNRRVEVIA